MQDGRQHLLALPLGVSDKHLQRKYNQRITKEVLMCTRENKSRCSLTLLFHCYISMLLQKIHVATVVCRFLRTPQGFVISFIYLHA